MNFDDKYALLGAKGCMYPKDFSKLNENTTPVSIPGRYFDYISGRLDEISTGTYMSRTTDAYLSGPPDFIHTGQSHCSKTVPVVDIYKEKPKMTYNLIVSQPLNGWAELKMNSANRIRKDSCYTNLPNKQL